MSVKESKDVLEFVLSLGSAIGKSLEDGKLSVGDLGFFLSALSSAAAAIKGVKELPAELADLDEEEKLELLSMVAQFDIPQDKVEAAIKSGFKVALDLIELLANIK